MKRIIVLILAIICAAMASAQTVTVTASNFGGSTPFTGIISWQPASADGKPVSVQLSGGGQTMMLPYKTYVTKGAFSITVPDVIVASPQSTCYRVTALLNGVNVLGPGYNCVQPHATAMSTDDWCQTGVCNFDSYVPNLAPMSLVGPRGAPGDVNRITLQTATPLVGLLYGNGSTVQTATSGQVQSIIGTGIYDAYGVSAAETTRALAAEAMLVPQTTTVNGHALSSNVTVSAADLAAGALPSGTTATTQTAGDSSTNVATTAYVDTRFPRPVLSYTLTSQTASIASTGVYTVPTSGVYRITGTLRTTTAGTAGTVVLTISGGASTGTLNLASASSTAYGQSVPNVGSGYVFVFSTAVTGNVGGAYRVDIFIERLM